ncbi:glycerophosphodiester phosphodiesterase [Nibribacter ruber]|uniref:Glycerophosphodiester phosphodiesterase n=1 Tax=Nibribacter ruber TaxID=2698458 RepID=A0A6P1P012_9BACT|nr:glycerophosphodiester phosphodiesterase family protein [Nibribacter ruber]QHL87845.1 glycerophosphodiester phosphodiesterase [Nibribacter ruber]
MAGLASTTERFTCFLKISLWLLLPALVGVVVSCTSSDPNAKVSLMQKNGRKISVIAHRGASYLAPENTLAAVKKALETSADFIEIDVHLSKDGQVVVIHDATVDRTTNGTGQVAQLTLEELKELDAGSKTDTAFAGERIPTLAQVLKTVKGKKKLLIELKKGEQDYYEGLEQKTLDVLKAHNATDWCVLQSFYDPILERIWQMDFMIPTHKLMMGKIPFLPIFFDHEFKFGSLDRYHEAAAINIHRHFASKSFITSLHNQGFKTFVWTEDDPKNIQQLFQNGADGVITNRPELIEKP